MTTDRDTLRKKIEQLVDEYRDWLGQFLETDSDDFTGMHTTRGIPDDGFYGKAEELKRKLPELIDAHDNALKEQLMAGKIAIYEDGGDNKRSFPAIPVTHIIEVFSKGETDD